MIATATVSELHPAMTEQEYKRERERIRATYGESSAEASAKRDQALAALFYRSGWTQEELAKVEGKSREWISKRVRFGHFLAFGTGVPNSENATFKLTEGKFRGYWQETDQKHNDRQRFTAVLRKLSEATLTAKRRSGLGRKIIDKFGDSKWHRLETIADHVGEQPEAIIELLGNMARTNNTYGVPICEKQKVGAKDGTWRYRIVRGGGQKVDLAALTQELSPILEELEYQGAQHTARYSPSAVLQCAHRIRTLLDRLTQQAAPSSGDRASRSKKQGEAQ